MKQGVAEWYRLQLKGKVWDGLKEHSLAGWNLGKVPIGYTGQKHPHPNPIKEDYSKLPLLKRLTCDDASKKPGFE